MECSVEKVLSYIKETLIKDNPSLSLGDLEELNADTDLIYYGIESILVLSIISELETLLKKFRLSILKVLIIVLQQNQSLKI